MRISIKEASFQDVEAGVGEGTWVGWQKIDFCVEKAVAAGDLQLFWIDTLRLLYHIISPAIGCCFGRLTLPACHLGFTYSRAFPKCLADKAQV